MDEILSAALSRIEPTAVWVPGGKARQCSYEIDPRVQHTLMKDPSILILGISGDAIAKTARAIGQKVYGVEINPAVIRLQTNELLPYNANSYQDIDVALMDGRSFINQSTQPYDMITLMSSHAARGNNRPVDQPPSPTSGSWL